MPKLPFRADPKVLTTMGETFADGSVLDLVTSASSGRVALLFHSAGKKKIATQIEHSRRIYQPPNLDEAMARAIRFPQDAKAYGSTRKLLRRVRQLFERHAGLPQSESALITAWAASSWFADCLSSPPTLLISGPEMGDAIRLLRLLHRVCRRPVLLGDLSRSAFLTLATLGATLLINQPDLSPRMRALWSTSNYRGVHVFGSGRVRSVASSKAVFLGMAYAREDEGVHLALPPRRSDVPTLDERQLEAIARELQPQLLMFRLRNLDDVCNFSARDRGPTLPSTEVARNLAASVLGDAEIAESIAPCLRRLEEDQLALRGCDVHLALVEVTWAPSHVDRELSISRLTELTNTLLRNRGGILEYSAVEIGWKLKNLGFRHHRNGQGMVLQFSLENRLLLHQLATQLSLGLRAVDNCPLCSPQEADAKRLM